MKITPEIKRFIEDNNSLSSRSLSTLIAEKFEVDVTYRAIEPHLKASRAESEASNAAKVEAVRAKILDDADAYAGKYLKILDEEIEAWRTLLRDGVLYFPANGNGVKEKIQICDIKDRQAASQSMHKYISTVIEFVKPGSDRSAKMGWLKDVPED
jgi:hypothetical protein